MSPMLGDEMLRSAYQSSTSRRGTSSDVPAPSLDDIASVIDREGSEAQRLAKLDAIMRDPETRREFELLRAVAAAAPRAPVRPFPISIVAFAAAAVLAVIAIPAVWRGEIGGGSPLRDGAQTTRLIAPPENASAREARRFVWHAYPEARRYRFELLTPGGDALFTTRTADTVLTVPDDVRLTSGSEYRWWVSSELADGTQRRSPFRRLTIRVAP